MKFFFIFHFDKSFDFLYFCDNTTPSMNVIMIAFPTATNQYRVYNNVCMTYIQFLSNMSHIQNLFDNNSLKGKHFKIA